MKRTFRLGSIAIAALVALAGVYLFAPFCGPDLRAHPHPAVDYAEAVVRIDSIRLAEESVPLAPGAQSIALVHGGRADTAVVLYHGYTVVPSQFELLARGYYERGCNVWVPRMPYHGYRDRMTNALSRLSADQLRDHADRAIDIAAGLGRRVIVVGLSGGGALVTWSAVARPEVREAIAISPILHPIGVPTWAEGALTRALRLLPDHYEWWNPVTKENEPGPAYPRFSYRGIGAFLMLGLWADAQAAPHAHPVRGDLVLVRNDSDQFVDGAYNLTHFQRLTAPERLRIVEIPAGARLGHDLVSLDGENRERIQLAYAFLSRAVGFELPDPRGAAPMGNGGLPRSVITPPGRGANGP